MRTAPQMYKNNYPQMFNDECKTHNNAVLDEDLGPFVEGSSGFDWLVKSGNKFLWVMVPTANGGEALIVSAKTTHAVCASGQDVISAGEGFCRDLKLYLNNQTGHYRVDFESLEYALPHWKSLGMNLKGIEISGHDKVLAAIRKEGAKEIKEQMENRSLDMLARHSRRRFSNSWATAPEM